jgi:hypothetical protein
MRWFGRFRRDLVDRSGEPVDVDRLVVEGLRDPASARLAVSELSRYRKDLFRRRRVMEKQFNQMAPARIRRMASSGPGMGTLQMTQDMRAHEAHTRDSGRMEQLAEVDREIEKVDKAVRQLRAQIRRSR